MNEAYEYTTAGRRLTDSEATCEDLATSNEWQSMRIGVEYIHTTGSTADQATIDFVMVQLSTIGGLPGFCHTCHKVVPILQGGEMTRHGFIRAEHPW